MTPLDVGSKTEFDIGRSSTDTTVARRRNKEELQVYVDTVDSVVSYVLDLVSEHY